MLLPHMLSKLVLARKSSTIARTTNDLACMDFLINAVDCGLVTCLFVLAFECLGTPWYGAR
jgi:hypothetical protein